MKSSRLPLLPTVLVAAAVAAMVALGVWQLGRAEWKAGLIERYQSAQETSSPVPWPQDRTAMERSLFRWSGFDCERVIGMRSGAGNNAQGRAGWAHVAHCALPDGGEAEVALGWTPGPQPPEWAGGEVQGIIAPGGQFGGTLQAAQQPGGLQALDPPDPADLPNNHLMYAGQWFLFAVTALVIYILALRRRRRG